MLLFYVAAGRTLARAWGRQGASSLTQEKIVFHSGMLEREQTNTV